MCGIIGYVGNRDAAPILLEGLQHLEYRGYDSAGIALVGPQGELQLQRAVGKLSTLVQQVGQRPFHGTVGMGHTRWATHGKPSIANAHPHTDCTGQVVVVHNGIVENFLALRKQLLDSGHILRSETDTELVAHLIEGHLSQGKALEQAVPAAMREIQGSHAFVILHLREPNKLIAVRIGNAGGITIGYAQDEMLVASDLIALSPYAKRIAFLDSREMVVATPHGASYFKLDGTPLSKGIQAVPFDSLSVAKGSYKHFMLKEVMEQPEVVLNALSGRVDMNNPDVHMEDLRLSTEELKRVQRVVLVAMGTSYHAALVGRTYMEQIARIPAEADNSSEFRYRNPVLGPETLVIAIAQSGETVDTLMAMEEARRQGAMLLAICNVPGSQATRLADCTLFMRARPEVSVPSTKTLTASITTLYLLALHLAKVRGVLDSQHLSACVNDLNSVPRALSETLEKAPLYESVASAYFRFSNFLYLGRGITYPIALEGALKLKEISYIHAEGYPAGEMKHGPIALIDEHMPVVALVPKDALRDKMLSNIEQVKARDGRVIAVASAEDDADLRSKVDHLITVPSVSLLLSPLVFLVPLQLLAYFVGVRRGCDVDQPRNLAKSVTVE
jgi:glucosamine--fructose-6-phosphate aminotransferase (isomerizing)